MTLENLNTLANWNGVVKPLKDVQVSVLDRAFLFGDSVYEVIRIYKGSFFRIDDHFSRMETSLASMNIKFVDIPEVRKRLIELQDTCKFDDALAYIQITRGVNKRTHHYPESYTPNVLIYIDPFDDPFDNERTNGATAVTHKDIRWKRNDIKATNLAANCMAASYAHDHGCLEVIFIDGNGYMTEGSRSSMFGIKDGALLVAPSSANVLPGITKRQVLEIAKNINLPIKEARVKEEDIFNLDELFLAGTSEEVLAIVKVDDKTIGDGKPGPIVKQLQAAFKKVLSTANSAC